MNIYSEISVPYVVACYTTSIVFVFTDHYSHPLYATFTWKSTTMEPSMGICILLELLFGLLSIVHDMLVYFPSEETDQGIRDIAEYCCDQFFLVSMSLAHNITCPNNTDIFDQISVTCFQIIISQFGQPYMEVEVFHDEL